ncbi:unnamed protein product [Linum trigynum]|uniref:Uncharacterized protein n=1 Tax=Linum trigynum TaxID=586398 RepID=A0AAV2FIW2_9ROSI
MAILSQRLSPFSGVMNVVGERSMMVSYLCLFNWYKFYHLLLVASPSFQFCFASCGLNFHTFPSLSKD